MKPIKNFEVPKDAVPFNPAKTVTIAAGASETMTLSGRGGAAYGFNRILPYADDMANVTVKALLNNERIIFQDVQLSVLREFFANGPTAAPFVIQRNNTLEFTLTNNAATDQTANIELLGYGTPTLIALKEAYEAQGLKMPTPVFFYAKELITAGISNQPVTIPNKSVDSEIVRAAIKTTNDNDLRVSLNLFNETIKNDVFIQQFNDEFSSGKPSQVPLKVGANEPFSLFANSASANDETLSFFAEAYPTKK